MTDWTQKILNQYADKQAAGANRLSLESFMSAPSPTEYDMKGSNFISGFNNGLNNLIKFAQTGDRRRAEARDEAIAAEEVNYQREQDAANMALRMGEEKRADQRFKLDQTIQNRALQKELEAEQQGKNTILFNRKMLTDLEGYKEKKGMVDTTVRAGIDSKYLQGDSKNNLKLVKPQNMTPEEQERYDVFKKQFNSLPNMSELRKGLETQWKTQAEDTLLDNDKSNDVGAYDTAGVWSTFDKSNAEKQASAEALSAAHQKDYDDFVLEETGSMSGKDKEFLTDYTAIKGNLEVSSDNYDNYVKNEKLNEEDKLEAKRLKVKFFNDERLKGKTDAEKNWIIGSALKSSKGLGQVDAAWGETFDAFTTMGQWADDQVSSTIDEQLNKLNTVKSTSDKIRQKGLETTQFINNINAEMGFLQGKNSLLRAVK